MAEPDEQKEDKAYTVRLPPDIYERLQDTAVTLGSNAAALSRMVIIEHLHDYEVRAEEVKRQKRRNRQAGT